MPRKDRNVHTGVELRDLGRIHSTARCPVWARQWLALERGAAGQAARQGTRSLQASSASDALFPKLEGGGTVLLIFLSMFLPT